MSGQITNGKVTFGRKLKPADYESADAIVELGFIVEEGKDPTEIMNYAAALAKSKVLELLGKQISATDAKAAYAAAQAGETTTPKTRKPRAAPKTVETKPVETTPGGDDPSAVENVPAPETKPVETTPTDVVPDDDFTASMPEVTDGDLKVACTKKAQAIGPAKIKTLIGRYVADKTKAGAGLADIPQEKRQAFLTELGSLA